MSDVCKEKDYEVLVCNPNQEDWKWKNVKRKTDRDDALKLAKLAALEQLVPAYVPAQQQREYRRLVKYRKVLTGRVNRIQNNIRAMFMQRGMPMTRGQKAWARQRFNELAKHRKPLAECSMDELWRGELDLELSQLEQLWKQQHEVHKKLKALAKQDERGQLLPIPGVGRKAAEVVVAYIDDPHCFKNARQVSSYAGLVPRRFQSGEMDRQGRIHKCGPRQLRTALVEAFWLMLRYNPLGQISLRATRQRAKNPQEESNRSSGPQTTGPLLGDAQTEGTLAEGHRRRERCRHGSIDIDMVTLSLK